METPIKLAINEWTGQHITTQLAGKILEEAGYKVEYVVAGYQNMWQAMAEGQLHAAMEVWASNVTDQYRQMHAAGQIEDLGELGLEAREGFVYTPPTAEQCPGLPDWEALKECVSIFVTAESLPLGRAVDYPAEYGTPGTDRIEPSACRTSRCRRVPKVLRSPRSAPRSSAGRRCSSSSGGRIGRSRNMSCNSLNCRKARPNATAILPMGQTRT